MEMSLYPFGRGDLSWISTTLYKQFHGYFTLGRELHDEEKKRGKNSIYQL